MNEMKAIAAVAEKVLNQLPIMTRNQIMLESKLDPKFIDSVVVPALKMPNPAKAIDDSMKEALLNEFMPSKHRKAVGKWSVLRKAVKGMVHQAKTAHAKGIADFGWEMTTTSTSTEPAKEPTIWDIIGGLFSTAAGAAATIYDSYADQQAAEAKAEADAQIAAMRGVVATTPTGAARPTAAAGAPSEGFPTWAIVAIIATAVVGGGAILLSRR